MESEPAIGAPMLERPSCGVLRRSRSMNRRLLARRARGLPTPTMEQNNRDLRHRFGGAHGAESAPETCYRAEEVLVNDQICLGLNLLDETSWFRVVEVVKTAHGVWLYVGIGDYRQRVFRQAGENLKVRRTRSHVAA